MPKVAQTLAERFWGKVDKDTGPVHPAIGTRCWVWTAYADRRGYGHMSVGNRRLAKAHRVGWELQHGSAPGDLLVCHRCDNPSCVRGDHLFLGTAIENNRDRDRKGRNARGERNGTRIYPERRARGERCGSSRLTEPDVREIRRRCAAGERYSLVANAFRVSPSTVAGVVRRETWEHVP